MTDVAPTMSSDTWRASTRVADVEVWLATHWRIALVALALFALVTGVLTMDNSPVGAADDAMYVMLARSLATGHGYRSINLPAAPLNTHFPPGFPFALSLLWRVSPSFPANLVLFRLFNAVCLAGIAIGVARLLASRGIARLWCVTLGAVSAISIPVLVLSTMLLSEPFFMALVLGLLVALERFVAPGEPETTALHGVLLGAAIGMCMLVRTHGFVLVPAVLALLARHRRWRDAAFVLLGVVLSLLPWKLYVARNEGALPAPLIGAYGSYLGWWVRGFQGRGWPMIPATVARTTPDLYVMFTTLFSPLHSAAGRVLGFVAVAVLALAGAVSLRRVMPVTLLFLAGYVAIVIVWPSQPVRFVWGVWPLILSVVLLGGRSAFTQRERWHGAVRAAVMLSLCWAVAGYALYEVRGIRGAWWTSIPRGSRPHIAHAIAWTSANTAPGDLVATEDDAAVFLYTGRPTVPVRSFTVDEFFGDATGATNARTGLVPLLAAYPVRAVIVYNRLAFDAAQLLTAPPHPLLAPRDESAEGATFTVIPR